MQAQRHSILIVEDDFLIALDLAEILESDGFAVLGPLGSVAEALELLHRERPAAAVLDVMLRGGEPVTPVARLLAAMTVPFVLASAQRPEYLARDRVLAQAVNLGKPLSPAALTHAVRGMVAA